MRCRFFNDFSYEWVQEKRNCINPHEMERARRIDRLYREKVEVGPQYFTAEEFCEFLRFKGLARRVPAFLRHYDNNDEVEEVTNKLFVNDLAERTFEDTQDEGLRHGILNTIKSLYTDLQWLKFVGPGVASACVALCFPELCGTVDYIVPALLHNERDPYNTITPLFRDPTTAQTLRKCLMMPIHHSLTAAAARKIAADNYEKYSQELWCIKKTFSLNHKIRYIEEAIWSFGICYVRLFRREI